MAWARISGIVRAQAASDHAMRLGCAEHRQRPERGLLEGRLPAIQHGHEEAANRTPSLRIGAAGRWTSRAVRSSRARAQALERPVGHRCPRIDGSRLRDADQSAQERRAAGRAGRRRSARPGRRDRRSSEAPSGRRPRPAGRWRRRRRARRCRVVRCVRISAIVQAPEGRGADVRRRHRPAADSRGDGSGRRGRRSAAARTSGLGSDANGPRSSPAKPAGRPRHGPDRRGADPGVLVFQRPRRARRGRRARRRARACVTAISRTPGSGARTASRSAVHDGRVVTSAAIPGPPSSTCSAAPERSASSRLPAYRRRIAHRDGDRHQGRARCPARTPGPGRGMVPAASSRTPDRIVPT